MEALKKKKIILDRSQRGRRRRADVELKPAGNSIDRVALVRKSFQINFPVITHVFLLSFRITNVYPEYIFDVPLSVYNNTRDPEGLLTVLRVVFERKIIQL